MDSHDGTGGHMQPLGYIEMDSHDGRGQVNREYVTLIPIDADPD